MYSAAPEQFHRLYRMDVLFACLLELMTVKGPKPARFVIARVGGRYRLAWSHAISLILAVNVCKPSTSQ